MIPWCLPVLAISHHIPLKGTHMILPKLSVRDVDASTAFYTRQLGFHLDFILPRADGISGLARLSPGDIRPGLSRVEADRPAGLTLRELSTREAEGY
jgi:hypothetical protein